MRGAIFFLALFCIDCADTHTSDEKILRDSVHTCNTTGDWKILPFLVTTGITNMSRLFYNCRSMNEDISNWDVSNVVDMHEMFWGASSFDHYLGHWDIINVKNMTNVFSFKLHEKTDTTLTRKNIRRTIDNWLPAVGTAILHLSQML